MNVDEALARADAEAYSTADVDVLAAEVRRLRAEQHEVACPSCGATIRARLADQAEQAELARLRAAVERVRALHRVSPVAPSYDPYCDACRYDDGWPCPTLRALDEEEE